MDAIVSAVKGVFPLLTTDQISKLVEHLMETCGVGEVDELQFLQEVDLVSVLKPIQIRKALQQWKHKVDSPATPSITAAPSTSCSLPSTPTSTTLQSTPTSDHSVSTPNSSRSHDQWLCTYMPGWTRMSAEIRRCLKSRQRPSPSARRAMVRVLVDEIRILCANPTKRQLGKVAEAIVVEYPDCFQDRTDDKDVVGVGYLSLQNQLRGRVENVNRSDDAANGSVRRRIITHDATQTQEGSVTVKKRKVADSYGCVNWQPELTVGTSYETLETQKLELQDEFKLGPQHWDRAKVRFSMEETYPLLRREINAQPPPNIQTLATEWPFLCQEMCLLDHFRTLTDIDVRNKFLSSTKAEKINSFMSTSSLSAKVKSTNAEISNDRAVFPAEKQSSLDMAAVHLLLLAYFNEDCSTLFVLAEATDTVDDVVQRDLPNTPCLIVLGNSLLVSQRFMLAIEQHVVCDDIASLNSGLAMLFASFYVLNLMYPEPVGTTLEFIQRCIACINPEMGTKVARAAKRKKEAANPRVLSLIKSIADYEWLR